MCSFQDSRLFEDEDYRRKNNVLSVLFLTFLCRESDFKLLLPSRSQWEAKVTQYERDFERVSATVRKEVVRFEVTMLH